MYQLVHKQLGIFQGLYGGALYWLNYSMSPFFGIWSFSSKEEIEGFLEAACFTGYLISGDFVVEIFDEELNEKLRTHSPSYVLPGNC